MKIIDFPFWMTYVWVLWYVKKVTSGQWACSIIATLGLGLCFWWMCDARWWYKANSETHRRLTTGFSILMFCEEVPGGPSCGQANLYTLIIFVHIFFFFFCDRQKGHGSHDGDVIHLYSASLKLVGFKLFNGRSMACAILHNFPGPGLLQRSRLATRVRHPDGLHG